MTNIFNKWSALDPALEREQIQNIAPTVISSGTVTPGVEFFDVALPAGQAQFQFNLVLVASVVDQPCFALSANAGTTFLNDVGGVDGYLTSGPPDPLALILNVGGTVAYTRLVIDIIQGTASTPLQWRVLLLTSGSAASPFSQGTWGGGPAYQRGGYTSLANTPVLNPFNLIRFLPTFGNGDCNPPTSGETFLSGTWELNAHA